MDEIERIMGVPASLLGDPSARLPAHAIGNLWRALGEAEPDRPLSLMLIEAAPLMSVAGIAHGAQFAATFRDALTFLADNAVLVTEATRLMLVETADEAQIEYAHDFSVLAGGRGLECSIGMTWRMAREVLRIDQPFLRIDFEHDASTATDAYQDFFGIPVRFGAKRSAAILRPAALDQAINTANVELFRFVLQHFGKLREDLEAADYPPELRKLRSAIIQNAQEGEFSAAAAARRARMSPRGAQRLAAEFGHSVQDLIDELRAGIALAVLQDASIGTSAAASILGYSDDRAFRRAFKRWTGQTPSEYRASLKNGRD